MKSRHTENHYFRMFCDLRLFIEQRVDFIYVNCLQLPVVDAAAVLYVCKNLFALSLHSLFLLYLLLCILGK